MNILTLLSESLKLELGSPPSVKTALKYLYSTLPASPLNPSELIIMGDDKEPLAGIKVWGFRDGIYLGNVRAFKSGGGRKALETLIIVADNHNIPIYITVEPTGNKNLTKSQLKAWYGRNGFVPIKNNNTDGDSMVLYPNT